MNKKTNKKYLIWYAFGAAIVLFAISFIVNETSLRDRIKSLSFNAGPEIAELEQKLELTDKAKTIFYASEPSLDDSEKFNSNCSSYDPTTAILGCYSGETIHIYNIESQELSGIVESTAAHELLHAVWERLSGAEKLELATDLEKVYEENCEKLCDVVSAYDESERNDEIYVRIGTQIKDLPETLENHYANYFVNRSKIIEYYDNYSATFDEIRANMDKLYSEIETLKEELEELSSNYNEKVESYEKSVKEFNTCARTANCFDASTFNSRRGELISEYNQIQELYATIESKTNNYNDKVSEYNANVIHGKNLENIINSNSAPSEI